MPSSEHGLRNPADPLTRLSRELQVELRRLFAAAGSDGYLHVCDIDRGGEVELDADALVVAASVFKVAVALEFFRQAAEGVLDPRERVRLDPKHSLGAPAGLALFTDEVEVSLRDLAVSMLTVSDSLATDALLHRLGIDRVNALTRSLGLRETLLVSDLRTMFDRLASEAGSRHGRICLGHAGATLTPRCRRAHWRRCERRALRILDGRREPPRVR